MSPKTLFSGFCLAAAFVFIMLGALGVITRDWSFWGGMPFFILAIVGFMVGYLDGDYEKEKG